MKKAIYLLFTLVVSLFLIQCTSEKKRQEKQLSQKLTEMAADLSASTPVMLDPYTQFDGAAVSEDRVFSYKYTIKNTPDPEQLVNDRMVDIKEELKKAFKVNPDLRIFTENNVNIQYVYNDTTGRVIKTISISPKDYK